MRNYKNRRAYTLAEIMVVMLILTLIFAAFSPIITRRMSKERSGEVWTTTGMPDYNAYTEPTVNDGEGQMFFGVTPAIKDDVKGIDLLPLSKIVVRAGDLNGKKQAHLHFRYGANGSGN